MSNLLTALAMIGPFNETGTMTHCNRAAFDNRKGPAIPIAESGFCPYIDLNPVETIDGDGHNYSRSSNLYELESWALFGEAYYNIRSDLKLRSEEHTSELQS